MAAQVTKQREQMLIDRIAQLRQEVAEERKGLGDTRSDDHEPFVNSSFETAIESIAFKEGRIAELEDLLNHADKVSVDPEHCAKRVGLGSKITVTLMKGDGEVETLVIVIDGIVIDSVDDKSSTMVRSPEAPMIQAILGAAAGEEPRPFMTPSGRLDVRIDSIEPAYNC